MNDREKFYAVQKMYCKLNSRDDGWIHCQDCTNFDNCEWRLYLKQDSFEYCERFVRKKENLL